MARRTSLERITDIAVDTARALEALNSLRQGKNGAAVATLVNTLEREIRGVVAARMKSRRKRRDNKGKFIR